MKVLRFLIKPIKLVVLLLAFSALIYFRSIVFHANVNQHINTALSYAEEKFKISIPSYLAANIQGEVAVQKECESIVDNVAVKDDNVETVSVAMESGKDIATDEKTEGAAAIMEVLAETVSSINKKVDMLFDADKASFAIEPASNNDEKDKVLVSVEQKTDNLVISSRENTSVSATDSVSIDAKQGLFMARQLFWKGEIHDSERGYLDLLNIDDSDPDIYGELGNVYYAQGKWKQAAEAYYEAAVRLLERDKNEQMGQQVNYLLRVIQGLDVVSAEKLRNKISG
ncbi:MAG: hypothetical protein OEY66_01245 [Gammaproteobacteria bacterium]|nr:hypothetical protein [Gammaproteobacteria bacterium]